MKENYDFSKGRRGAVVTEPHKIRICIRLDSKIVKWFKKKVEANKGGNYQSLINQALLEYMLHKGEPLEKVLRRVLREELHHDVPKNLRPKSDDDTHRTAAG